MASGAPAFESSSQDNESVARGARPPSALRGGSRETAMRARRTYDRTFFERVAHANAVQADLMKSSAIKLDESLKLLAEVRDLLRR